MVNKKIGVYIFLFLLVASLVSFTVSAQTQPANTNVNVNGNINVSMSLPSATLKERCGKYEDANGNALNGYAACVMFNFFAPMGFDDQWTGIIMGLLASAIIFGMFFDIADLVLPFSKWVNILIVSSFVAGSIIIGLIRMIVAWGLMLGSLITGTAGAVAIVASAVLLVLGLIAMLFGVKGLTRWFKKIKNNKKNFEESLKAKTGAARIAGGADTLAAVDASARRAGTGPGIGIP